MSQSKKTHPTFGDLNTGDMFNTKAARYVKAGLDRAMVVMSGVLELGSVHKCEQDENNIVVLPSRSRLIEEEGPLGCFRSFGRGSLDIRSG